MPSLRELRKRLQSVKTTGQLAGAMRTVSTAKYQRASSMLAAGEPYSEACRLLSRELGGFTGEELEAFSSELIRKEAAPAFGETAADGLKSGAQGEQDMHL